MAAHNLAFLLQLLPGEGLAFPVGSRDGFYSVPNSSVTRTGSCVQPGVEPEHSWL